VRSRLRALAYPGEDPNTLPSAETVMPVYLDLMAKKDKFPRSKRINVADYLNDN
jgi:hypothetical protein